MASTPPTEEEDTDEEPEVPAGVIGGIEDVGEERTAAGDDLDEALDL